MRGEHTRWLTVSVRISGPSPHARGTHDHDVQLQRQKRTIPACAGNTGTAFGPGVLQRDHPRMRGEHLPMILDNRHPTGPPPHARGTPERQPRT